MFKLFSVFSDNALFQADSILSIRGFADESSQLFAKIIGDEYSFECNSFSLDDGIFSIQLKTPGASFNKYSIVVSDGEQEIVIKNVMFGELWFAGGQSNMELPNNDINEHEWYLNKLKDFDIRIYAQDYGPNENFSTVAHYELEGRWISTRDTSVMKCVSACGTAFIKGLYEHFQNSCNYKNVPVGFLNISWGATTIEAWLPKEKLISKARVLEFLEKHNRNYNEDNINDSSLMLIQKPMVMFNRKVTPLLGVKFRGIIWYQGESNLWCEPEERIYSEFLLMFYETYKELFAVDINNFKMICSLIYPWRYKNYGETDVGYLNEAFVSLSKKYPDKFVCCPNYDLPPSWQSLNNHPIHPMHKYPLGERLSKLALSNVYGFDGQKSPSFMRDCRREGNRLIVTYDAAEKGLYTCDRKHVRGMYIAGENRLYMPADCEVISDSEIAVWHPYLSNPIHCMYGRSSVETNLNLFSGEFPVMPFSTDSDNEEPILLELKSFLNLEVLSELDCFDDESPYPDWYYRPVWKALDGCEVCSDNAFAMISDGRFNSVGVGGAKNPFGMYATSHHSFAFDFKNYASLEADVYSAGELNFNVMLKYEDGNIFDIKASLTGASSDRFNHYSVSFEDIPDGRIVRMDFVFSIENGKVMKHANIGRLYLKPKESF